MVATILKVVAYLVAAAALFLLFVARYSVPPSELPLKIVIVGISLSLAYLVGLFLINSRVAQARHVVLRVVRVGVAAGLVSWPVFVGLLLTQTVVMRGGIVASMVLLFLLLLCQELVGAGVKRSSGVLLLSAPAILIVTLLQSWNGDTAVNARDLPDYVYTSLNDLKITSHVLLESADELDGGGIDVFGKDQVLMATAQGEIYLAHVGKNQIELDSIATNPPLNRNEYLEQSPIRGAVRVTDLMVLPGERREQRVLMSHLYWNSVQQCVTLRLSEAAFDLSGRGRMLGDWVSRYESAPCIDIDVSIESGGRLGLLSDSSVLMTVGTNNFDVANDYAYDSVDPGVSYGKIVAIDLENYQVEVFSTGHRNPQGLLVDAGQVWATEHGPQGGDELNVIQSGEHYGWPENTYGTAYGRKIGYTEHSAGTHKVGRRPFFVWIPSIGVSHLIRVRGKLFDGWQGDLLVGSLGSANSLFRLRVRGGRTIFSERILTRQPVRDLVELSDGRFVVWNGRDIMQVIEPGEQLISACLGCHAFDGVPRMGPNLKGVVGRQIASADYAYSEAMLNWKGRWTKDRLDDYLRDPKGMLPGTSMDFAGVKDPRERAAIIEALARCGAGQNRC